MLRGGCEKVDHQFRGSPDQGAGADRSPRLTPLWSAMKVVFGMLLLAANLAGCQSVPSGEPASEAKPEVHGLEVDQGASGLTVLPIRRDVTCPTSCPVSMAPDVITPLVYDGSGVEGPPPGWPGPPDGPDPPPAHPPHEDGYKYCELYALTGDLYLCGKPPKCPGLIFSPKTQQLLEVTVTSFGVPCDIKLFKPYVVKPVSELTLVAGTEFVPLLPQPPAPTHPCATLQVRERFLNAGLVTVDYPQTLRVDERGYLVGSLALFTAPTKINVVLRGSNPKGDAELRFTINLVPAGNEIGR